MRSFASAAAHGKASGRSGYRSRLASHTPEKSGFPSRVRGTGRRGTTDRLRTIAASVPGSSPYVFKEPPSPSRMLSSNASPALTITSPFTKGRKAQHGISMEISYVPAVKLVSVYRPSDLLIVRAVAPVALFLAWIGASGTAAPFGPVRNFGRL